MSIEYIIGVALGIFIGLIFVAIFLKITKKDGKMKCKYDERQMLARGKGFKYGFFTLMLYDFIYGVLDIAIEKPFVDSLVAMTIGVVLSIAVYVVYCIWKDAYISLNENPGRVLFSFAMIAIANFLIGIGSLIHGDAIEDGVLNYRIVNLICAILFVVIFIAFLIKRMVSKAEAE